MAAGSNSHSSAGLSLQYTSADMTFDEAMFEWHDVNCNAAALVADTLKFAASQADKRRPQG